MTPTLYLLGEFPFGQTLVFQGDATLRGHVLTLASGAEVDVSGRAFAVDGTLTCPGGTLGIVLEGGEGPGDDVEAAGLTAPPVVQQDR